MTTGQAPAFSISTRKWLRERGVEGDAVVRHALDGLEIAGTQGLLRISGSQVRLARTGWRSAKYGPFFLTSLWLEGSDKPLQLEHRGLPALAYAAVIRGLAGQLTSAERVKRLHRGSAIAAALEVVIPMGALFVVAVLIATFARAEEEPWQRLVPPGVASLCLALGAGIAIIRWPRAVRDLAKLNRRVAPEPGQFR